MAAPSPPPFSKHLCATCARCREVATGRSTFHLCTRHRDDPDRYPRYPRIPVLRCDGHEPRGSG